MKEAMAIIKQTEEGTQSVFFDQDNLECARLNKRTKKRVEKAQMEQMAKAQKHRKSQAAKASFYKYTSKTARNVLIELVSAVALVWAGSAEMIHPWIWIPVSILCLCVACVQIGMWFGKAGKK